TMGAKSCFTRWLITAALALPVTPTPLTPEGAGRQRRAEFCGTIATALPPLLARHPRLRVQLLVTNRRIDLIEENVDVAVRVRERLDTDADLTLRVIGRASNFLVAAPSRFEGR
ncbi:hypothetical protein J8J40_24570, partial [Mycobacterium tuberculosis]|nr:hypothetical protein [Mycobacterium tuberculosis]